MPEPLSQQPQTLQLTVAKAEAGMDALQFVSSLISSLAWPVVVVVFLILFRANIAKLMDRLRKAKLGSAVDISLDHNEAQLEVTEAIAPPNKFEKAANTGIALDEMPTSLTPEAQERTAQLRDLEKAPLDPAETIERLWRLVEQAVRQVARRKGVAGEHINKPVFVLGKHMKGQELFSTQVMVMLAELRKTRNLAAHGEEVTPEAAQRYFRIAARFIMLLESL